MVLLRSGKPEVTEELLKYSDLDNQLKMELEIIVNLSKINSGDTLIVPRKAPAIYITNPDPHTLVSTLENIYSLDLIRNEHTILDECFRDIIRGRLDIPHKNEAYTFHANEIYAFDLTDSEKEPKLLKFDGVIGHKIDVLQTILEKGLEGKLSYKDLMYCRTCNPMYPVDYTMIFSTKNIKDILKQYETDEKDVVSLREIPRKR